MFHSNTMIRNVSLVEDNEFRFRLRADKADCCTYIFQPITAFKRYLTPLKSPILATQFKLRLERTTYFLIGDRNTGSFFKWTLIIDQVNIT